MATYQSLSDSLVELAGKINVHAYETDNIKLNDVINNPAVISKNKVLELLTLRNQLQFLSSQLTLIFDTNITISSLNNDDVSKSINSPKYNKIPKNVSGKIPKIGMTKTNKIPTGRTLIAKSFKVMPPSESILQSTEPINEQKIDIQSENVDIKPDETLGEN